MLPNWESTNPCSPANRQPEAGAGGRFCQGGVWADDVDTGSTAKKEERTGTGAGDSTIGETTGGGMRSGGGCTKYGTKGA